MDEPRSRHPYRMYDAIFAQPEAFVRVFEKNRAAADEYAAGASSSERLFLVGIGTSYHAARVGEHLLREYGGGLDVRAIHSFDFALYGPDLAPGDWVVALSHRGTKRYTARALERAIESGCRTALVTGEGASVSVQTDALFRTVAREGSAAHTVSYTAAISIRGRLAGRSGYHRTGSETLTEAYLRDEFPAALGTALGTEERVEALAHER